VADLKTLVDYFLPKPSIDSALIKMSQLLEQRYSIPEPDTTANEDGGES